MNHSPASPTSHRPQTNLALEREDEETWDRAMSGSWVTTRAVVPFLLFSTIGGAILGAIAWPWVAVMEEAIGNSLFGVGHPVYAQLSRVSGLAAYSLLCLAMLLGLMQSTRMARTWPGVLEAFELHRYVSLLGLSFTLFHVIVLVGDQRVGGQFANLILPFAMLHLFPWSWWGQLALYGLIAASLSFYLRRFLGKKAWRVVHMLSIGFYLMALVHSVGASQASSTPAMSAFYWITGGSVVLFIGYRGGSALWSKRSSRAGRANRARNASKDATKAAGSA